jgi:patatin-like phospholipase/acyl hydrolase
MFDYASLFQRFRTKYNAEPLAALLQQEIGPETTLGSDKLKTLLLLILRNATTDSPWPLSNNPQAKYNQLDRPNCNLHLPLWQLVRASTAAPTYFPPEVIGMGGRILFSWMAGSRCTITRPSSCS